MEVGWWHGWRWALRVSNLRAVREVQALCWRNAGSLTFAPLIDTV